MTTDVNKYTVGQFKIEFSTTGNQGKLIETQIRVNNQNVPQRQVWVERAGRMSAIREAALFGKKAEFDDVFTNFQSLSVPSERTVYASISPVSNRKVFVVRRNTDGGEGYFTLLEQSTEFDRHKDGVLITVDRVSKL